MEQRNALLRQVTQGLSKVPLKSFEHSADYTYLDQALRSYWTQFESLESDMRAFTPRPIADFDEWREGELKRLAVLNPGKPAEALARLVDQQLEFIAAPRWQFREQFDQRHMTLYVSVVLLSHSLSEALANAVLALGLASAGAPELFRILERAQFKRKWLIGPKAFDPTYAFPTGTALHETLGTLAQERNALVHQKIELTVEGVRVLEGTHFRRRGYDQDLVWLRRFFSLPYDLSVFAHRSFKDLRPMLLFRRSPIEAVKEHADAIAAATGDA